MATLGVGLQEHLRVGRVVEGVVGVVRDLVPTKGWVVAHATVS